MLDVELKTTEPMTVAFVSMHGAYSQTPEGMGTLYGWVAQHGLQPAGMPRAVYFTEPGDGPEEQTAWELQAPLAGEPAEQPADASGCGIRRIEPQYVASVMYKGPYESIAPTYEELGTWVEANGYRMAGPPAEAYYSDPNDTPPEEYLTEIIFPIAKV